LSPMTLKGLAQTLTWGTEERLKDNQMIYL